MKHLKAIIILVIALVCTNLNINAQSAEAILKSASEKLTKSKSVSADFSITSGNTISKGNIVMSGKRFKMTSDQLSTWFDGKTQWSYNPEIEEVNISEPTDEELQQINPLTIISDFKKSYNCKLLNSASGLHKIELTAKTTNTSISKVVLTLNSKTYYPTTIVVTFDNNSTTTINVSNLKIGNALPKSTFIFNQSDYPDAEIIDLR